MKGRKKEGRTGMGESPPHPVPGRRGKRRDMQKVDRVKEKTVSCAKAWGAKQREGCEFGRATDAKNAKARGYAQEWGAKLSLIQH